MGRGEVGWGVRRAGRERGTSEAGGREDEDEDDDETRIGTSRGAGIGGIAAEAG